MVMEASISTVWERGSFALLSGSLVFERRGLGEVSESSASSAVRVVI